MNLLLLLLLLIGSVGEASEKAIIAVVDTGLDLNDERFKPYLCPSGHQDFTGTGIEDHHSHGTHVAGIIVKYAEDSNYCIVVIKYLNKDGRDELTYIPHLKALDYAGNIGSTIINFSSGGPGPDIYEAYVVGNHPSSLFVVAAGNESQNLDVLCNYFPACYSFFNIISVGNLYNGQVAKSSNYGKVVDAWEEGEQWSTLPNGKMGTKIGTSMSAAVRTGKIINKRYHR